MLDEQHLHATRVDAWLERSARGLPAALLPRLLELAFGALWAQTVTTLGEVTLTAIAERVVCRTMEKYPHIGQLDVDAGGLRSAGLDPTAPKLREAIRFVILEFLTVMGTLTAGLLTPELHATLAHVSLPRAARGQREKTS